MQPEPNFRPMTGRSPVELSVAGEDGDLNVRFYRSPMDGKDHIEIHIPGDNTMVVDEVVDAEYLNRFRPQWEAYQSGVEDDSTRLGEVPWIDAATAVALTSVHVNTVEQLAALRDDALPPGTLMGVNGLRTRAQEFLNDKRKVSEHADLSAKIEELSAELAALKGADKPAAGRKTARA